jgi:hypothetical protein
MANLFQREASKVMHIDNPRQLRIVPFEPIHKDANFHNGFRVRAVGTHAAQFQRYRDQTAIGGFGTFRLRFFGLNASEVCNVYTLRY